MSQGRTKHGLAPSGPAFTSRHSTLTARCLPFAIRTPFTLLFFSPGLIWLLVGSGCRENEPGFEVITLEGKIEKIERTSDVIGEISVLYYSEKHGQEMIGLGLITTETEIMINGAVAKLRDLREGDHVRGEVRVEKKGGEKKQVALKIYVDRPKPTGGGGI